MWMRSAIRGLLAAQCLLALAACQAPVDRETLSVDPAVQVSRANGRSVFWAGGCASCHAGVGTLSTKAPELGGGQDMQTPFGVFRAPNISPDTTDGIGGWTLATFDRAMRQGISPDGRAYYPAFPYDSYTRMTDGDIADLFAYLQSLPAVSGDVENSAPAFPANLSVAAQTWRRLYLRPGPVVDLADAGPEVAQGQYLVEGPGHCGTCHTPRTPLGGPRLGDWLGGAEMLDGTGLAPNLTPHEDGLGDWTLDEIVEALHPLDAGESYEGMAAARIDLAFLPEGDLLAIAAYLKALPPVAAAP